MSRAYTFSESVRFLRFIDEDDEDDENDEEDDFSYQEFVLNRLQQNNTIHITPMKHVSSEKNPHLLNSQSETTLSTTIQSGLPNQVLDLQAVAKRVNQKGSPPNFTTSDAVLLRFKRNSRHLFGSEQFDKQSITMNCPTIHY